MYTVYRSDSTPPLPQKDKGVFFLICMLVAMAMACVITLAANRMYLAAQVKETVVAETCVSEQ